MTWSGSWLLVESRWREGNLTRRDSSPDLTFTKGVLYGQGETRTYDSLLVREALYSYAGERYLTCGHIQLTFQLLAPGLRG